MPTNDSFPSFLPETNRPPQKGDRYAFERADSSQWQAQAAGEVWTPPESRLNRLSAAVETTDRAIADARSSKSEGDPYQLVFRAGAKVRAEGMTESAEADYRAAISLADRMNAQAVLNALQDKQNSRSALEARFLATQAAQNSDGGRLQQLHANADKESYQLYRQYLAPATTRSNMGLAYIGTGDDRMIAKGEQLILDSIKLRPELQFNAEFQRHLLEAYGEMERKRMAAGLPLRPVGIQPVDYSKPARTLSIPPQFNNHREASFENPYKHLDAAKAGIRQNDTQSALQSFQKAIQAADRLSANAILEDRAEVFRHRMCLDRDMTRAQVRGANTQDMQRQRQDLVSREWQLYQQYMAPATTRTSMAFALIGSGNPQNIAQGQKLIQDAVKLRPELEYTQEFRSSLQQAYREAYSRNPSARPQGTTNDVVPQLPGRRPERNNPNNPRVNPGSDSGKQPGGTQPGDNPPGVRPPGNPQGTVPGGDVKPSQPKNPSADRKQAGSDFLPPTEDPTPNKPDVQPVQPVQPPLTKPETADKAVSDNPPSFLPLPPEHIPGQEPQDQIERDKLTDTLKWINSNPWALMLMTIAGYKLVKQGGKWLFKKRDGTEAKPAEGDKPGTEEKPSTEEKPKAEDKTSEDKSKTEDKTKVENKLSAQKEAELKSLKEELAKAEENLRQAKEASSADRATMQQQIDDLKGKVEAAEKEKLQAQQKSADDRTTFDKQAADLAAKLQAAEQARQTAEQHATQQREAFTKQVDELKTKLDQAQKDRLSASDKSISDVKALDAQIKELKQKLETAQTEKATQEQRATTEKAAADKELATIKEQLESLQREKRASEETSGREKKALEQQITELKETLKTKGLLDGQVVELQKKLADAEQQKAAADGKTASEKASFEQQLKELTTKLEEAGRKSATADQAAAQEKQRLAQQIQELQQKLEKVSGEASQANQASTTAQKEAAELRQKLASAETARQAAETKAADEKTQSEQRIATMAKTIEQAEQIQKAADEKAKSDKAQFDKRLASAQQELEAKRAELAEAVKSGDAKATQLDSRIKELETTLATTKGESEKTQSQLKAAQEDLARQMSELRQQLAKAQQDKITLEQNAAKDKATFDQQVNEVKAKLEQAEGKLKQQSAPNPASSDVTVSETKAPTVADGHEVLPKIKMGQSIDNWKVAGVDGGDVIVKDQSDNKGLSGKELQTFEADKFHKIEVKGESGALYRRNGTDKVYKMVGVLTPSGQPMKDGPQFLVLVDGIEVKGPRSPVYRGLTEGKATTVVEDAGKSTAKTADTAAEKAAAEKAGTEKPAIEKPATEKPAVEKPAADKATADRQRVLNDLVSAWKEMQGQKVGDGYSQDVATIFEQTEALKGDSWTKEQRAEFASMKAAYEAQKSEGIGKRPTIDFINGFLNNPAQNMGSNTNKAETTDKTTTNTSDKPVVTGDKQHSDAARSATETKRIVALETFVGPDGVRHAKPIPVGSLTVEWMEERIKIITPEDIENARKSGNEKLAQELELHRNEYLKRTTPEERRSYADAVTQDYRAKAEAASTPKQNSSTPAQRSGARSETAGARPKGSGGLGVLGKTGLVSAGLVVLTVTVGDDSAPIKIDTSQIIPTGR